MEDYLFPIATYLLRTILVVTITYTQKALFCSTITRRKVQTSDLTGVFSYPSTADDGNT